MTFNLTRALVCFVIAISGSAAALDCSADDLQYPLSIAVARNGDVFLADRHLPGIWKLADGKLSVFYRASKKFRTTLNAVRCVCLDREDKLLAGDSATRNVYRFDDEGQPHPITKSTKGMGLIGIPMDIAVNSKGDVYVSDLEIQRIVKISNGSDQPEEVAEISGCRGLFVDQDDALWVVSTTEDQLHHITSAAKQTVIAKARPFQFPHTVVVDKDGAAYVCDGYAKTIWKITPGGKPIAFSKGPPLVSPVGLALHDDVVYVADPRAKAVFTIDAAGNITKVEYQGDG